MTVFQPLVCKWKLDDVCVLTGCQMPTKCVWTVTHRQEHSYKTFSSAYFQDHCNPPGCMILINVGIWVSYLFPFPPFTVCFHLFCLNSQVISWLAVTSECYRPKGTIEQIDLSIFLKTSETGRGSNVLSIFVESL